MAPTLVLVAVAAEMLPDGAVPVLLLVLEVPHAVPLAVVMIADQLRMTIEIAKQVQVKSLKDAAPQFYPPALISMGSMEINRQSI